MTRKFRSSMVWVLAVCMTLAPQAALAQEKGRPLDTALLSPDVCLVAVVHPHRVLQAPAAEMLPREVFTAASLQELGVDAAELDRVQTYVEKPTGNGVPNNAVLVFDFLKPVDPQVVFEKLEIPVEKATVEGKSIWRVVGAPLPFVIYAPRETTIVYGAEPLVARLLRGEAAAATHPLLKSLVALGEPNDVVAIMSFEQLRPQIEAMLGQAPPSSPFDNFNKAPLLMELAVARLNISNPGPSGLALVAHNEQEAAELAKLANQGLDLGREMFLAQMNRQMPSGEPDAVQLATQAYTQRITTKVFDALRPVRKGRVVALEQTNIGQNAQMNMAVIGGAMAALLPAVTASRAAARRMASSNNLKNITLAMLMYENEHRHYPRRAILSKEGKPLLSWRVAILPYLEEDELYEKFRLDEPWDSEHNRALLSEMPDVFKDLSSGVSDQFKTNYLAPVGEETMFATEKGFGIKFIRDGTSKTILVVTADDSHAVEWTKPADLKYDPKQPRAGLSKLRPNGFLAGFADGRVVFLSSSLDPEVLRALFTPAGGEPVNRDNF